MVQDIPARKRIAFLLIVLTVISLSGGTASAATKKVVSASSKKITTTNTTKNKKATTKKPSATKATAKKVKGEVVSANKVSVIGDNTITTYTVKSGDTLSGIAKKFDITVNTIRWSNDIKSSDTIRAGETLTILPTNGVKYTVKNGDTLSAIAVKFSADQDDILNANDLKNANSLKVGMTLIIPDVEPLSDSPVSAITTPTPIAPITVPETASPAVVPPPTQTPAGATVIVTNPVTTNSYPITITPSTSSSGYAIPTQDVRGYYAQPVSGRLSQGIHDVNAVDIATPVGTSVHAAASGTIIVAMGNGKYNGGYGNYIVISHPNGTQTLYAHLSKVDVVLGQTVIQGEPIGLSGATGKVTGAHLHLEIRGATNPWGADPIGTIYSM